MSLRLISTSLSATLILSIALIGQAQEPTTTTALQTPTVIQPSVQSEPFFVTFTPIKRGIGPTPEATFGCSIGPVSVTTMYSPSSISFNDGISCSTAVGLYGTTVLFVYNTNQIDAYGTQINTTSTSAASSGAYYGPVRGTTYAVNFNVDITPPAGYTTNPSGACSYISGGPRVHCTVGSGPISY